MELRDTVSLFSTEVFTDVFNSLTSFKGKVNPFAEVTNSGSASQRRILEVSHNVSVPASRVIQATSGEKFIVADANVDYWNGQVIRYKYPVYPVANMGAVGNIGQTLTDTQPDKFVYAYPFFVGQDTNIEERSDFLSRFEVYFPKVKHFLRSSILKLGTDYYRLKSETTIDGGGFGVSLGIKLENPVRVLTVKRRGAEYDSTVDGYIETVINGVVCFVEPLDQDYEFVTPSFTSIEVGDLAISVLKSSLLVNVNDEIGNYRVLSVRETDSWSTCQCRSMGTIENMILTYMTDDEDGSFLIVDGSEPPIFLIED